MAESVATEVLNKTAVIVPSSERSGKGPNDDDNIVEVQRDAKYVIKHATTCGKSALITCGNNVWSFVAKIAERIASCKNINTQTGGTTFKV